MSELQLDQLERLRSNRIVGRWVLLGVIMLVIQVVLGGITRLTGSGLSITEWDILTGALPPLNEKNWLIEFHKYQQTPQYHLLNFDFTLSDFKSIFFWEWFHRFWARLVAVVFAIPFAYFLYKKIITKEMVRPLLILFFLGALQGAVGWIMVASGLTGDAIYVKPTKLAMHFVLACILISYAFWFALELLTKKENMMRHRGLRNFTAWMIGLLLIQLVFGSLMAGHKAAPVAPTWPGINGSFVPDYVFNRPNGLMSIIEDPIVIHFIHRSIAYLFVILVVVWTIRSLRVPATPAFARARWLPLFFVVLQLVLGICTVFTSIRIRPAKWNLFEWMAQCHQLVAILLLLSLVANLFLLSGKKTLNP